ncbi:MAG: DUF2281 domain-containing protein [Moraxellaceae bacterium]|nr:DUF2281 domain-containing protein [Moraxellaceae bacterium]
MSLAQIIQQHVDLLPQYQQAEVLDFVLFLEQKHSFNVVNEKTKTKFGGSLCVTSTKRSI